MAAGTLLQEAQVDRLHIAIDLSNSVVSISR